MKMLDFSNRSAVSRCMKNFFFLWEFLLNSWTLHTLSMKLHLIFVCLIMKQKSTYPGSLCCHFLQGIHNDKKNVWLLRLSTWFIFHFKESGFLCVLFQLIEGRDKDITSSSPLVRLDMLSLNFVNVDFFYKLHSDSSTGIFVRKRNCL